MELAHVAGQLVYARGPLRKVSPSLGYTVLDVPASGASVPVGGSMGENLFFLPEPRRPHDRPEEPTRATVTVNVRPSGRPTACWQR